MRLTGEIREGRFVRRLNRFSAEAVVGGRRVLIHVPNSGRLGELLVSGRPVLLRRQEGDHRLTAYDLCSVGVRRGWVCIDARLPPRLVEEALRTRKFEGFKGYRVEGREIGLGGGRIDLLLRGPRGRCYLETKSVTLAVRGTALFPDAPTARGRRHLLDLREACEQGMEAAVVFVVQRADASRFTPNWRTDPQFARALVRVAAAGVRVRAYACQVTRTGLKIARALPIHLMPRNDDGHAVA